MPQMQYHCSVTNYYGLQCTRRPNHRGAHSCCGSIWFGDVSSERRELRKLALAKESKTYESRGGYAFSDDVDQ